MSDHCQQPNVEEVHNTVAFTCGLHKIGLHSTAATVATMCGLSHCWVTMMMLGNAGDLKHVLAHSTG